MKYELIILLNQETEIDKVKSLITAVNGKLEKEEKWGEKTLAYPIKKKHRAIFYDLFIEVDKDKTGELRKKLNFNDKILRFLLLQA